MRNHLLYIILPLGMSAYLFADSGIDMGGSSTTVRFDAHGRPYTTVHTGADADPIERLSHYQYLKQYIPNIKASDVDRACKEDLRKMYYSAIRAQGISMGEAHRITENIDL